MNAIYIILKVNTHIYIYIYISQMIYEIGEDADTQIIHNSIVYLLFAKLIDVEFDRKIQYRLSEIIPFDR